ncbi:MAG: ABC transporter ATP-binding protein [Candidatus Paceibacterota bacterium]
MPLFELSHIEKKYPDGTHALRGISFSIEKGDFVSIMGPSGSGKSTLLHILGFLDDYTAGEFLFEGKRYRDYTPDEIAQVRNEKMGFIFQSFNLLSRATVFDNVMLPLLYSKVPQNERKETVLSAIESVGLSHRIEHMSSQLSGGERQRVAIARALVNNPNVIFADEPTGNLDSKSGEVIMDIICDLNKKKNHTVILITHETYTAEYAERIITIRDGLLEKEVAVENRKFGSGSFIK